MLVKVRFASVVQSNISSLCVAFQLMIKMPVDTRTVLQLSILLLAVPVQYFLTQYMSTTPSQRSVALKRYAVYTYIKSHFGKFLQVLPFLCGKYQVYVILSCFSVVTSATSITANLLSWTSWKEWCSGILNNFGNFSPVLPEDDRGECPAIEVIKFDDPDGYFAGIDQFLNISYYQLFRLLSLWFLLSLKCM